MLPLNAFSKILGAIANPAGQCPHSGPNPILTPDLVRLQPPSPIPIETHLIK